MTAMHYLSLLRAEFKLVYGEMFRRKASLLTLIMYPYLFTGFVLFVGYSVGQPLYFEQRVGVNPLLFMMTSSYILMALLAVVDDVLWRPLSDNWIGTLQYIIASPVDKTVLFLAIPVPRLTALLALGLTSVLPVFTYYMGIEGLVYSALVILLTGLGALAMSTMALVITGIVHSYASSWRSLNIVRPILLVLIGAYYPRAFMPMVARAMSYLVPASYTVEYVQLLLAKVAEPVNTTLLLLMALVSTAYLIYGKRVIEMWETRLIKHGGKAR